MKEITLTLTAEEVKRLSLAAMANEYSLNKEAREAKDDDLRYNKERSAAMWQKLHDKIKAQEMAQRETTEC